MWRAEFGVRSEPNHPIRNVSPTTSPTTRSRYWSPAPGRSRVRVLLVQLDGRLPNIALMRLSAHHRPLGDNVTFRQIGNPQAIHPDLFDNPDRVYASTIPLGDSHVTVGFRRNFPVGWGRSHTDGGINTTINVELPEARSESERWCERCKKTGRVMHCLGTCRFRCCGWPV